MQIPSGKNFQDLIVSIIGEPDFVRRLRSYIISASPTLKLVTGNLVEGWSLLLTHRPHVLFLEIGPRYTDRTHVAARHLLEQARDRFSREMYVIVALAAPETLFFGGDLLLQNDGKPSGLVDSFIAVPPGSIPSIPSLPEQALHALQHCGYEFARRAEGKDPLPCLCDEGWVQSLADPRSRELWMRWLPRYASYTNENPIIIGQTGTGKTNLANALHRFSGRKGQFVGITPRDFSSSELVQAELFGAVAGAYTGAVDKWGLVKSAEKGTLFIDELQSIDKDLQGKLITFIENKAYRRVGSAESVAADVRFVFASNRTLYDMMETDILRHDFAYRLERVQLELAPLHMRRLDIVAALAYALARVRKQRPHAYPVHGFNSTAFRLLFSHRWPGNLRQLENSVAQLCELADMDEISVVSEQAVGVLFESKLRGLATTSSDIMAQAALTLAQETLQGSVASLDGGIERFRRLARDVAIEATGGDSNRASEMLGDDPSLLALLVEADTAVRSLGKR